MAKTVKAGKAGKAGKQEQSMIYELPKSILLTYDDPTSSFSGNLKANVVLSTYAGVGKYDCEVQTVFTPYLKESREEGSTLTLLTYLPLGSVTVVGDLASLVTQVIQLKRGDYSFLKKGSRWLLRLDDAIKADGALSTNIASGPFANLSGSTTLAAIKPAVGKAGVGRTETTVWAGSTFGSSLVGCRLGNICCPAGQCYDVQAGKCIDCG